MSVNRNYLVYMLICIYPFFNILISFLSKGQNMNTFSVIYSLLIFLLIFFTNKNVNIKGCLPIFFILIFTIIINLLRGPFYEDMRDIVVYITTVLMLIIYSKKYIDISLFADFIRRNYILLFVIQILFYIVLWEDFLINGFYMGWNTLVLKGPYLYPHTLAYLILFMLMVNIYLFLFNNSKISGFFIALNIVLVIMTAVRTGLIVIGINLCFMIWYSFKQKKYKTILFIVLLFIIVVSMLFDYGLFEAIIEKSELAVDNSDISSGRGNIAISSLQALNNDILNIVFGVGMREIFLTNQINIGAGIHAHNDFVDVLVAYGIINFILYCSFFYNFIRKFLITGLLTLGIMAYGNGLYCYIDCIPLLIFSRLLFENKK